MDDFAKEVKKRFDELQNKEQNLRTQIADLKKSQKPLRAYLIEAGIIEKRSRKSNANKSTTNQ